MLGEGRGIVNKLLILLALLLFTVFILLGIWQLQRGFTKQNLQHLYQSRNQLTALELKQQNLNKLTDEQYRLVKASGFFDNQHQFLIDKIYKHQLGYYVLTPLKLINSNQVVLINRGWVAYQHDRSSLITLQPVNTLVTIVGKLTYPQSNFILGDFSENASWPKRIQTLDLERIAAILATPIVPFIILLNNDQPNGFLREWAPVDLNANVNFGYAAQWFLLAITLLVICLVLNYRRSPNDA